MKITKSKRSTLWSFAGLMWMLTGLASSLTHGSSGVFIALGAICLFLAYRARRSEQAAAKLADAKKDKP